MGTRDPCAVGSFDSVILHATTPLIERLRDKSSLSVKDLKECLSTVKTISQLLSALDRFNNVSEVSDAKEKLLCSIVRDICFPLLYSLNLLPESDKANSEKGRALNLLVNLILACCYDLSDQTLPTVATQLLIPLCSALKTPDSTLLSLVDEAYHKSKDEPLNQYLSLELVGAFLMDENLFRRYLSNTGQLGLKDEELLKRLFDTCVGCVDEDSAFSKAFTVTAKLLAYFTEELREECISQIWASYTSPPALTSTSDRGSVWKSLYVFFCLKNYFFPVEMSAKDKLATWLTSDKFWSIVQTGLVSPEPLHRKLAVYLLKRLTDTCDKNSCTVNFQPGTCVEAPMFWWSPAFKKQLSVVWEDFILLIEVLEEKQVHVVKPLLPRMKNLVKAASCSTKEVNPMLHSSWLVTIVTRCFHHDSHYMSRWGAHTLLTLDFQEVPFIQHGQLRFLSHDLLIHLQENRLYSRYEGTELGKCSPVGEGLKRFFPHLFGCLTKEKKVEYLGNLLTIVCENNWGSIPLLFVFEGLSHVQPDPIINPALLLLVRQILQSCLTTHEAITKGAIQCFICEMLINLVDMDCVSVKEIMRTFAALSREESFRRGTQLWSKALALVAQATEAGKWSKQEATSQALAFLKDCHADNSVTVEGYRVVAKARMLLLYADLAEKNSSVQENKSGETISDKASQEAVVESPLGLVLAEVSDTLDGLRTRAYVDVGRVNRSLSLLYSLSREAGALTESAVDRLLKAKFALHFQDVSHFVKARILEDLTKVGDMDQVEFYMDVLLALGLCCKHTQVADLLSFVSRVFDKSKSLPAGESVGEMDVLVTSSTKLLRTLCKLAEARLSQSPDNGSLQDLVACVLALDSVPRPFSQRQASTDVTSRASQGEAISSYISSKWDCWSFLFQHSRGSGDGVSVSQILDAAMEDLAIGSGGSDVSVYKALIGLVPQIVSQAKPEEVATFLDLSWSKVMEEKKNRLFWEKLEVLVPLALHPAILAEDPSSDVGAALDRFLEKMQALGEDKSGILYLVFENLCEHGLTKENDADRKLAVRLIPLLIEGSFMGQLHKKGERLWLDVCAYIESLGDKCCVNLLTSSISKNDVFTRVCVLNWLANLRPEEEADIRFAQAYLEHLRVRYLALAKMTTYKQFSNSLSHRQKHRMILVFLLLVDFIQEDLCESYMSMLWQALELECHPSVRQNLEWLVLILLQRYPRLVDSLWETFTLYTQRRSVCLCSLFLILSHMGVNLPQDLKPAFYQQALTVVLPWTMAHHYNTRVFAQACLVKLWQQCQALAADTCVTSQFSVVQQAVDFVINNGNASNTVLKLLESYMFHSFDPIQDYSLETILYTLPRLACLADDEWISPGQIVQWDKTWLSQHARRLPLRNSTQKLSECKVGPWRMKAHIENDDDVSESADGSGDVQKKIMPWRQMSPDQDTEAELESKQRQRSRGGGLVLVTSLIDKVPNLGGLCRTSEIFGVSEFVIGNLTHLEDRMFQSLSVSAQKWVNITEVMRPRISEYLEEKRTEGYTLVGVEQTANSVCLQEYKFPKKTLLLLGNEKEGIPVDVIQSLDVCVEIPQLGIIRSLNVHVCGALIVWEYTRQHMQQQQQQ